MSNKAESDLTPTLVKGKRKIAEKAPASSPRIQLPDDPGNLQAAEASGSWHKSPSGKPLHVWSAQEVEALTRLTKGLKSSGDIDFEEVAARLPSVTPRTAKACKVYWSRHLQSIQRGQGKL